MGDVEPQNWLSSSIKLSSSVTLPARFWVVGSVLPAIMVSITSFADGSVESGFSCWLFNILKLYISLIPPKSA